MANSISPEQLAKALGGARVASGIAFVALSEPLGHLLIGSQADSAGAQLYIRAFGARDALLGSGALLATRRQRTARPWLIAAGLADAFDAAATAVAYRRLPPRRRALTFTVSLIPALLNLGTARRLVDMPAV
jgi:hypothetical protein